jgi:hypothetical protein
MKLLRRGRYCAPIAEGKAKSAGGKNHLEKNHTRLAGARQPLVRKFEKDSRKNAVNGATIRQQKRESVRPAGASYTASMEESMKLKIALAIALVSSISPVLAQPNPHPNPTTSHLHGVPGMHDRAPRPHIHESQPHH